MGQKRVLKSWSKRNVPEEIWPEILSRLPVKSLLRFRCVSKSWRSFIDDPNFARLHLNRFQNNCDETRLFIHNFGGEWVLRSSKTLRTTSRLSSPESRNQCIDISPSTILEEKLRWDLICSVGGLFVLLGTIGNGITELWVWNPSMRKSRRLPSFPTESPIPVDYIDMGMGYDPLVNDYKYVRLVFRLRRLSSIGVYTVGSHSWKTIHYQGKEHPYWRWFAGHFLDTVCFKSCLYMIARGHDSHTKKLASFDLTTEEFSIIDLPESISRHPRYAKLLIYGGCSLATFLYSDSSTRSSLWVYHSSDPGAEKGFTCWIELFIIPRVISTCLYMKKNGEILQIEEEMPRQAISYNPEKMEFKILLRRNRVSDMLKVCAYKESLIQP